eukprot:comp22022_c0_seq2/m.31930 comp22022_c0_seq2/g.31930  ORF comp22022_c0_seq2/g.31930 comp22022_c0_seq2/m.31930 type:complete len:435 (-) comp22022_c0_seq2:403-1707(-)
MMQSFASLASRAAALGVSKSALAAVARRSYSMAAEATAAAAGQRKEPHSADSLLALGTRRIFNEEHDMFRETARKYFEEKVRPFHAKWEQEGQVSRDCWLQAGELGLLGCNTSEKYGGIGTDILYSAIVWEEQAYSGLTGPGFALHSDIVMPYIENYGTDEQRMKFLPKMTTGECIGAIAMTEPAAGSDLAGMKTTATPQSDGTFVINGSKVFITNGQMADCVIVCAKTAPEKGPHGITLFLVERGMPGFERGKNLKKMGMKAQDTSELFFDNLVVGPDAVLGKVNHGFYYLMQELPQERLLIADMAVAAAEAYYEWTRSYVKERKAFGKTLSSLQTIRHTLAEMKTEVSVGRAFIDQCIELHKEKRLTTATASMAKYWGTDLQNKIADQGVQLHGGWGYMTEYPICRGYIDARVQRIYGGSNEIMKELIARDI